MKISFDSIITPIGFAFIKEEIPKMSSHLDINDLFFHLQQKCLEEDLKCARKKVLKNILEVVQKFLK